MREMKDSEIKWVGEIPSSWRMLRNKYIFKRTKQIVGDDWDKTQLLSLTTSGIKKRNIDDVYGKVPESYNGYQVVQPEQLVMCLFDLDCSAVFSGISPFEGMISPAYVVIECNDRMMPQFADYWFRFVFDGRKYNTYSKNIRFSLPYDDFCEVLTAVPPLSEQRAIVAYLDSKCADIDEAIKRHKEIIEKLEEFQEATITKTVTQGINKTTLKPSGYDVIGEIPDDWKVVRLRFIGSAMNGISKDGGSFGQGFPFVSYGDVYKNISLPTTVAGLVESSGEERLKYSVQAGDIFFTRTSETIDEVGFSSVCETTIPEATFAGFLIRVRPFTDMLVPSFAKYYFRGKHLRNYFAREMDITTRASLSQNFLKNVPVLIPPKNEQVQIAEYLTNVCDSISTSVAKHESIIAKLEEYKKSIIYNAVTGKIDCVGGFK